MKYLITGLGNPGFEYEQTRHNIGWMILDHLITEDTATFKSERYGAITRIKHKGRTLVLLKPSTYMNLSGKAVRYWLEKERIPLENLLVISDDLDLELGKLRMKGKGSGGTHNGLNHIIETLQTTQFARLRFGIGHDFPQGYQVEYVLGKFSSEENKLLEPRIEKACEMIRSFTTIGVGRTMSAYNNK
ncbi:MAG: aminoacyl-tRNA hydrolase [Bacteroidetes bacterium]|nr:MAG: aminoacyl-tRNA hydrolase [Bacteroidota bacterium]